MFALGSLYWHLVLRLQAVAQPMDNRVDFVILRTIVTMPKALKIVTNNIFPRGFTFVVWRG